MSAQVSHPTAISRPFASAVAWAGVALGVVGLVTHQLWAALPTARFGETLLLAGLAWLAAWPLRRWRQWRWADALGSVWLLALLWLTGVVPALAVAAVAMAAVALGGCVIGRGKPLLALLSGLALMAGVLGWLLPLPVHRWWILAPLLALLIVLRRGQLGGDARLAWQSWRGAVLEAPVAAAFAVMALGLGSAGAWLPTMQHDDLGYHLALPWQLMLQGRYALDPSHQVWAMAPWAGDVLHALPQLLARAEARSALNGLWFAATAAGLWRIGTLLALAPALRWASLALFASLPLVAALLGSMQTETAATAVMVTLAALILDPRARERKHLFAAALLVGLLFALKPMHGVAALPLLAWATWRLRGNVDWRALPPASAMIALVAGSSYAYAWQIAGNPVLPLFNSVFRSRFFPARDFADERWNGGFDVSLFWDITFDTSRYLEAWDGGVGFVLIVFAGAWLLALGSSRTRGLALCATLAMVVPLAVMQYARYAHPGMVLMLPALLAALQAGLQPRQAANLIVALCVLNFAFQGNAHWMLHTGGIKRSLGHLGNDHAMFARYVPERALAQALRERAGNDRVVLLMDPAFPYYAEFMQHGRGTAWYDPGLEAARLAAEQDASGQAWAALLRDAGIDEVLLRPESLTPAQAAGLALVFARHELTIGEAQWWRLTGERAP